MPSARVHVKKREGEMPPAGVPSDLEDVGALAGQSSDLQEILNLALDRVLEVIDVDVAYIALIDEESGTCRIIAYRALSEVLTVEGTEVSLGTCVEGKVVESADSLVMEDMGTESQACWSLLVQEQLRGYVGVPLKSRGRILGVMSIGSYGPQRFTTSALSHLTALAGHLGTVMENSLLRQQLGSFQSRLRERVKELSVIYDVSREAMGAEDIGSFLRFIAQRLPASMQYQEAIVVASCTVGENSYLGWSDKIDRGMAETLRIVPGEARAGTTLIEERLLLEYDLSHLEPSWLDCGVKSVLAVPITIEEQAIGSISVFYVTEDWRFLEEEKYLLQGISEQIAQFIARDAIRRENIQHAQEISTLFEVSKALASVVELERLLPTIQDTLVETLAPAEAGVMLLFDEGTGMLTIESAFGYDMKPLRNISLEVGESMSGKVFESGKPEVWATPEEAASAMANMGPHNLESYRQASGGLAHPKSGIGVPLFYREGKIGVLTVETLRNKAALSVSDLPFLQAVAEVIVINVDKIRLLQQTERTGAIEEANRLKSELIAALAHDMRTPLTSIKGYTSALLLDDLEWDERAKAEYLRIIDEEASELQTMIQDLLESSIIDAGLMQIEKEPTLIPRLAEKVVQEMTRRTAKHRFVMSFPSDFPIVNADPRRIEQVLRNLLDNAVKYSPDGGLVVVRGQLRDEGVTVSVADEGVGIPPEHLNRLFEKFFRLKSPLGQQVRGSGLGLPISRTIVESHGGRIWAESELGRGTTIYFSLPLEGPEAESRQD